ncbi:MAG TPA: NAD-dependent epimerase/dehydratase family protein, partial [Deltaproteobacteria bacterium]|nr:NAD-dependent epimerase/dehydratase family protein [Deltaproteobacteria bacterium]
MRTYFVTGGAGFIGSNFVLRQRRLGRARIINLDLLTYAGNPMNLEPIRSDPDYIFVRGNIGDRKMVRDIL